MHITKSLQIVYMGADCHVLIIKLCEFRFRIETKQLFITQTKKKKLNFPRIKNKILENEIKNPFLDC